MKIGVIIPAGGKGKRFNHTYKPLLKINGKTLLQVVVEKFLRVKNVEKIVIPTYKPYLSKVTNCLKELIKLYPSIISIIPGGQERKFSVFYGFKYLVENTNVQIIIIHDAVRPLLTSHLIKKLIRNIKNADAVIPVKPIPETVKEVIANRVAKTLDRSKLFLSLTPQVFKKAVLEKAYKNIPLNKHPITDEAQLVEMLGKKVKIIIYQGYNIKITYREDYKIVKWLIKEEENERN
jgi:2-C-methyl-D-erythritol 4-phosphate cytidylyltransferase